MSQNRRQNGLPDHILHNPDLLQGIFNYSTTTEQIKADAQVMEAIRNGEFTEDFLKGPHGLAYYYLIRDASLARTSISLENHMNPTLKHESEFIGAADRLVRCVEKHPEYASKSVQAQNRVCAKEYKEMRDKAFKNELLYHNMNKRFFMDLLTFKRHEAPF